MTFTESNTIEAMVRDLTHPPTPSRFGRGSLASPLPASGRGGGGVELRRNP